MLLLSFYSLPILNSFDQIRQNFRDLRSINFLQIHECVDLISLPAQGRSSTSSFPGYLRESSFIFKILFVENKTIYFAVHSITCFFDRLQLSVLVYEDSK